MSKNLKNIRQTLSEMLKTGITKLIQKLKLKKKEVNEKNFETKETKLK